MNAQITELLSSLSKDKNKIAVVAEQLEHMLAQSSKKGKVYPDVTKDGVTYRLCMWSKRYFPLEDFVGGEKKKNYTRAAYKIWNGFYSGADKMRKEASLKLFNNEVDMLGFKQLIEEANAYEARKDSIVEYAELAEKGYTLEELS